MPIRRLPKPIGDPELAALLTKFDRGTTVDGNKTIHFHDLGWETLERILPDAVEADPSLTPRQVRSILRQALRTCRKNEQLTSDHLLAEAQRIARTELAKPPEIYSSWTKFRAKQMALSKGFQIEWSGVKLKASNRLPLYMNLNEYFFNGHGRVKPGEPVFYGFLVARCDARTEENAVVQMLDAIEVFMAVFNMYELWERHSRGTERWGGGQTLERSLSVCISRQDIPWQRTPLV